MEGTFMRIGIPKESGYHRNPCRCDAENGRAATEAGFSVAIESGNNWQVLTTKCLRRLACDIVDGNAGPQSEIILAVNASGRRGNVFTEPPDHAGQFYLACAKSRLMEKLAERKVTVMRWTCAAYFPRAIARRVKLNNGEYRGVIAPL